MDVEKFRTAVVGLSKTIRWPFYVIVAVGYVVLLVYGIQSPTSAPKNQLTVVASVLQVSGNCQIAGRVLQDGDAVSRALIWAVVDYANGQHASPAPTQTDEHGGFTVACAPVSASAAYGEMADATVFARKELPGSWFHPGATLRGQDSVEWSSAALAPPPNAPLGVSPILVTPLALLFLGSVVVAFFGEPVLWRYRTAILLAVGFTACMIAYLGYFLKYVSTEGKSTELLQLGFASIYRGTYVKDVPVEWFFSFTSPPPQAPASQQAAPPPQNAQQSAPSAQPAPTLSAGAPPVSPVASQAQPATPLPSPAQAGPTVDHGFGAPLWVLLVSVLGAGVVTISLIVDEIANMNSITAVSPAEQPVEIRKHVQTIVQHQFFVLFAPITAVFVYQALVVGSAATSSFMVGFTALGAGPSLSALLTKAGAAATKLFKS